MSRHQRNRERCESTLGCANLEILESRQLLSALFLNAGPQFVLPSNAAPLSIGHGSIVTAGAVNHFVPIVFPSAPGATGVLQLNGGVLHLGASGSLSLTGGSTTVTGGLIVNNGTGSGTVILSGGSTGSGVVNISNGSLTVAGGLTTTINAGTASFNGTVVLGNQGTGTGPQLTINPGGTLTLSALALSGATMSLGDNDTLNISPNVLNLKLVVTLSDDQYAQVSQAGVQAIKGVTIQSPIISGSTLSGPGQVTLA